MKSFFIKLKVRERGERGEAQHEKSGRAGPGTGSMGGKCSVCGDRATKVSTLLHNLLIPSRERVGGDGSGLYFPFKAKLIELLFNSEKLA